MRAGRLNATITIQQKGVTRDGVGGEVVTWTTFATVRAEAQPLRGREYASLRAAQADLSIRFRMRYVADVNPKMRVLWENNPYGIVEVIDVNGRHRELELMCTGAAEDV